MEDQITGFRKVHSTSQNARNSATYASSGTASSQFFTFGDNGHYTVYARILDKDGGSTDYQTVVNVTNVAPSASIIGTPSTSLEGTPIVATSTVVDPGAADSFTYAWTVTKDGSPFATGGSAGFSFTPDDDAKYVVTLTVTDNDGDSGSASKEIIVSNIDPTLTISGSAATSEGATYTLGLVSSDPGADTINHWTIQWGDGSPLQTVSGNPSSVTHVYTDGPNNWIISATATDEDGTFSASSTIAVQVNNVAPTVTLSGPASADEGQTKHYTFTTTDPGFDTFSVVAVSGGSMGTVSDLQFDSATGAGSFDVTFLDGPATSTVSVQIQDSDNLLGNVSTIAVTVNNVAPTATINGAPASSPEGTAISLTSTVTDVGLADTFSYAWSVTKNGSAYAAGTNPNFSFTPNDNGTYVVSLTVKDDDLGTGSDSNTISVFNVQPTATINDAPASSPEGTAISLTSTVTDVGSADTFSYAWSVTKNGSAFAAGTNANFSFTPNDNGTYVVSLTVNDDDLGTSSDSKTISVFNVAPSALLNNSGPVSEGVPVVVSFSNPTDPSLADTTTTFRYSFALTSSDLVASYAAAGPASSQSFTFNNNGTYTVYGRIFDKDNGAADYQTTVAIANVGILLLDKTGSGALTDTGNGSVIVGGDGAIVVASTHPTAVTVSGNGNVIAKELDLASSTGTIINGNGKINALINRSVSTTLTADPLADLAVPSVTGLTTYAAVNYSGNQSLTLQPGNYNGGIRISGNGNVTLLPGVYYLNGGGFSVTGNGSVTGTGVLLYNAATTSSDVISISGKGSVILTAQTTGIYHDVVLFQRRTATAPISVTGKGGLNLTGSLYAAAAPVNLSGDGPLTVKNATGTLGRLVAADLKVSGNGSVTVNTSSGSGASGNLSIAVGYQPSLVDAALINSISQLTIGMRTVAVDGLDEMVASDKQSRFDDALATLNSDLGPYGVSLVQVYGDLAASADIHVHLASTSSIGGAGAGILGVTAGGNEITLIQGWDWYTGSNPLLIADNQYDFQTVVTHELGHTLGLGHSGDSNSVMYPALSTGTVRRHLSAQDVTLLDDEQESEPELLLAITGKPAHQGPSSVNPVVLMTTADHGGEASQEQSTGSVLASQFNSLAPAAALEHWTSDPSSGKNSSIHEELDSLFSSRELDRLLMDTTDTLPSYTDQRQNSVPWGFGLPVKLLRMLAFGRSSGPSAL